MVAFTRTPQEVYNPVDASNNPRGLDMAEAGLLALEMSLVAASQVSGPFSESWSATQSYKIGERVLYDGSIWYCLAAPNVNKVPGIDAAYWQVALGALSGATPLSRKLSLASSTANEASINIASGSKPTLSVGGDIYRIGNRLFYEFGGGFGNDLMMPFQPASWPTGMSMETMIAQSAVFASYPNTAIIPYDNTTPLIGEGQSILSGSYTPRKASTNVMFEYAGLISASVAANIVIGLFVDGACIAATVENFVSAGTKSVILRSGAKVFTATTAAPVEVRIGNGGAGGAIIGVNGSSSTGLFGGSAVSTLRASETSVYTP